MDSYQPPPHHGYMRPPPSMGSDPQYPQHNHYPPPPLQPSLPQSTTSSWNPGQYQYHSSHSASPPPQNQWGPPPPPPPPPQPPAYPTHPHQSYPAPPSYPPPPPPPSYPNQDWGNVNWTHHSGWEYPPAHSHEEDWAAKAKAWASARSALENQQPQSQYTSATRQEDPSHYANQYPQPVEPHFQDTQQPSMPTSSYSSYQGPVTPLHRPPAHHQQDPSSVNSYASEPHFSYNANDVAPGGDMGAGFARVQGHTNSSVHQQEVPSSYSSIPGNEDGFRGNQLGNSSLPADGRGLPVVHTQFGYGNQSFDPMDQPLDFASRFSHGNDSKMMSSYPDSSGHVRGTDSAAAVSSSHSWTAPAAPGASYPPIAPAFPSAFQHDHVGVPPIPGQHSPLFATGPGFQPPVPTHDILGSGMGLHSAAAFSVDAYGVLLNAERPKKAAVPNWLREEIIKTKATIASSAPDHFKEGSQSFDDELIDKPNEIDDQADSKSRNSARLAEDDDEDEEDPQKTAAINREIKRVLTEVLLKVTDELFDDIATKVMSEDDHTANAFAVSDDSILVPKVSSPPPPPPPPPLSAPRASAKVIIPAKAKESEEHETSSGSAGNVLGLANYSSDEDNEIPASSIPKFDSDGSHGASKNGVPIEAAEHRNNQVYAEADNSNSSGVHSEYGVPASKLNDHRISKEVPYNNDLVAYSGSTVSVNEKGDSVIVDAVKSTNNVHEETINGPDVSVEKRNVRTVARDNSPEEGAKRHDRHDSKRSSSGRDNHKVTESNRGREAEKDEIYSQRDERHKKKDKTEDSKRAREREMKERSPRHREKGRGSDSRKESPHREAKDSKYERERDYKRSSKDADRKRERTKEEKNDKSGHRSRDVGRHKRRRSSSVDSRGKPSKERTVLSNSSSDEASEDSRRKNRSKTRKLSPSPVRSRRRDRRSRSKSPVRHHRR